jgi:hypothetical protein
VLDWRGGVAPEVFAELRLRQPKRLQQPAHSFKIRRDFIKQTVRLGDLVAEEDRDMGVM